MVYDKHESKNFIELFWLEGVLFTFEEGNEYVVFPVIVEPILFLVNLVNFKN